MARRANPQRDRRGARAKTSGGAMPGTVTGSRATAGPGTVGGAGPLTAPGSGVGVGSEGASGVASGVGLGTAPNAPATALGAAPTAPTKPETAPETTLETELDPPLSPPLAVLSVLVFTAVAVLSAAVEVVLVPLRVGSVVVPVSVALALVGNVAIPVLSRRAVPITFAAVLPAVGWVATVLVLSQARPEGDVLLVGTPPLVYVTYALLGVGVLAAMVTVIRGQTHAFADHRPGVG